jgi:hypothetical protein
MAQETLQQPPGDELPTSPFDDKPMASNHRNSRIAAIASVVGSIIAALTPGSPICAALQTIWTFASNLF